MKKFTFIFGIIVSIAMLSCQSGNKEIANLNAKKISYPETKKVDTIDVYFGQEVADPYRWLEDDNSQETAEWIQAQNAITQNYLEKIPFRSALKRRFEEIWDYPKTEIPVKKGRYYYFFKNNGLQNQSVLYVQKTLNDKPEVFIDPNTFSADGTIAITHISPSDDGKYFAYSISRGGSDWNEIVVMNTETRAMLVDTIRWVKFSRISWYNDGFYYSCYDVPKEGTELSAVNKFHKVKYHKLGTSQSDDILVFDDKERPLNSFGCDVTDDNEYIVINVARSILYVRKTSDSDAAFTRIVYYEGNFKYIGCIEEGLLMLTDDDAPCGKLIAIDPERPDRENWKTIVPENKNVLQSAQLVGNVIFASYLQDASSKGCLYDYEGNLLKELELPALGSIAGISGDRDDSIAFYNYTSFTFPSRIYKLNLNTYQSELYIDNKIDFDSDNFTVEQLFFSSKDSTQIPLFLVYRNDLQRDGNNPVLLQGYGGFSISFPPSFNMAIIPFLEQGGIYAFANLRGGGEYGREWFLDGARMNRQNVFDDFISAAEYLIENNYTNSNKLAITGRSNGGLLIGACMTQRPDLFKVAIPVVGVLDMLRYQNFTSGKSWMGYYGYSNESEEMFRYLYNYSPLHNIKEGVEYPATLATTADHDDRVVPAHTFKFIAELQAKQTGNNPVLVRVDINAGHDAGKPTSKRIEENADVYSFIMYNLEMNPKFRKTKRR